MVKIDFIINGFSDCLHLADNHGLTDAEIEAMKQQRLDNWLAIVNAPHTEMLDEDGNIVPVISE